MSGNTTHPRPGLAALDARALAALLDAWSRGEGTPDGEGDGFLCELGGLHAANAELWDLEDRVRRVDLPAEAVAAAKRAIDAANLRRNRRIEALDLRILDLLGEAGVEMRPDAPCHTESPGMILDRLSIFSLRIHAYREDVSVPMENGDAVASRERCKAAAAGREALVAAAEGFFRELSRGERRFHPARELKRYRPHPDGTT